MDKYIPCRWMTSFVYLRNLATSDIRYRVSLGVAIQHAAREDSDQNARMRKLI